MSHGLPEVIMVADTGERPGGFVSHPRVLLDEGGSRYYVKLLDDPSPGNVLAAELICYHLVGELGLANFEGCIAYVDFPLQQGWVELEGGVFAPGDESVVAGEFTGPHYATKELDRSHIPLQALTFDELADPQDALKVWMFDTWVGITDRSQPGNLRGILNEDGKYVLVPIDNGNAFYGPEWHPEALQVLPARDRPEPVAGTHEIAHRIGVDSIPNIINRIQGIPKVRIQEIIQAVPPDWDYGPEDRGIAFDYLVAQRGILGNLFPEGEIGG